tara:strand:- start:19 stop:300 length:282 start_codon:yes stop_codon:yes gene_type:complete
MREPNNNSIALDYEKHKKEEMLCRIPAYELTKRKRSKAPEKLMVKTDDEQCKVIEQMKARKKHTGRDLFLKFREIDEKYKDLENKIFITNSST